VIHHRKTSQNIITEHRHRKAEGLLPALPICSSVIGFIISFFLYLLYSDSNHVSSTLGFDNALQVKDRIVRL
jgi:hypothetical protein